METLKIKKAYKGMAMEGPIAAWYSKLTAKDLGRHQYMAQKLSQYIPTDGSVLEIAPGPGFFCIALAKLGHYQITGLDISKSFVEIARKNAAEAGLKMEFRLGNASDMPFEDESFDFTFCQAAFKNFSEPVRAIAERYRVLRKGGVSVIADMRSDASKADLDQEVENLHLDPLNKLMTRWTFRQMLVKSAYSIDRMKAMVDQTPFGTGRMEVSGIGFQLWLEKHA